MHVLKQLLNYLCIVLKTNLPSSENFCLLQARGGSFTAALQSSLLLLRRGALRSGRPFATKAGKPHPTHPAHVPQGPATPQPAPPPKGQHHAPAPAQPEASQLLRHPHHYSSSSSSSASTSILHHHHHQPQYFKQYRNVTLATHKHSSPFSFIFSTNKHQQQVNYGISHHLHTSHLISPESLMGGEIGKVAVDFLYQ